MLDATKINELYQKISPNEKPYYEKIISNIQKIDTNEMFDLIEIAINKFHEDHTKYNLYVPNDKIGSEHWIIKTMLENNERFNIHPEYVMFGGEGKFPNDYPVLIIDDAIYSSCHMCSHIDELRHTHHVTNKFIIVVALLASQNRMALNAPYFNAKIYYGMIGEEKIFRNLFPELNFDIGYNIFNIETTNVVPIYFQHKIANSFGCYPFIKTILKDKPDRSMIDVLTINDIKHILAEKTNYDSV